MLLISSSVSGLNRTMSSTRFRNSGRKWRRSSAMTRVAGAFPDVPSGVMPSIR